MTKKHFFSQLKAENFNTELDNAIVTHYANLRQASCCNHTSYTKCNRIDTDLTIDKEKGKAPAS